MAHPPKNHSQAQIHQEGHEIADDVHPVEGPEPEEGIGDQHLEELHSRLRRRPQRIGAYLNDDQHHAGQRRPGSENYQSLPFPHIVPDRNAVYESHRYLQESPTRL